MLESKELGISKKFTKISANCLIEILDNATRYSTKGSDVIIEHHLTKHAITIIVENQSNFRDIEFLMLQVENYSRMTIIELENLYRQKLNNNNFNDRGGAGLGLLLIMKKECFSEIKVSPKLGAESQILCRLELKLLDTDHNSIIQS